MVSSGRNSPLAPPARAGVPQIRVNLREKLKKFM
jgi:hypothetical protein